MTPRQKDVHPKEAPIFGRDGGVMMVPGHPKGWALPGGRYTANRREAERVADTIERITNANGGIATTFAENRTPLTQEQSA